MQPRTKVPACNNVPAFSAPDTHPACADLQDLRHHILISLWHTCGRRSRLWYDSGSNCARQQARIAASSADASPPVGALPPADTAACSVARWLSTPTCRCSAAAAGAEAGEVGPAALGSPLDTPAGWLAAAALPLEDAQKKLWNSASTSAVWHMLVPPGRLAPLTRWL